MHNHLLFETPRVMYLHIGGQGDPVRLAQVIHSALLATKTPMSTSAPSQGGPLDLDTKQLDTLLGYHGKANNGVYQYSIPRAETITDGGVAIPPAMGVATVINFQPTGQGKAAITGDFVLLGKEVPPVMRALRAQGIDVTALHSHMLSDSPHLFFLPSGEMRRPRPWPGDCAQRSIKPRASRRRHENRSSYTGAKRT